MFNYPKIEIWSNQPQKRKIFAPSFLFLLSWTSTTSNGTIEKLSHIFSFNINFSFYWTYFHVIQMIVKTYKNPKNVANEYFFMKQMTDEPNIGWLCIVCRKFELFIFFWLKFVSMNIENYLKIGELVISAWVRKFESDFLSTSSQNKSKRNLTRENQFNHKSFMLSLLYVCWVFM